MFQWGIHHWQHSAAGYETKEESKERHKLWDISADIWQRKAFVLVTVSCQKRRHQTWASPQNMLPITHTFERLICAPHHLNLAVEGWSSAVAEIVWDKWAASCQEDTLEMRALVLFLSCFHVGNNTSMQHQCLTLLLLLITEPNSFVNKSKLLPWGYRAVVFVFKSLCSVPVLLLSFEHSPRHSLWSFYTTGSFHGKRTDRTKMLIRLSPSLTGWTALGSLAPF